MADPFAVIASQGGSLSLEPKKEYRQTLVIAEDTLITGEDSTIWSSEGPVIKVKSGAKLTLSNVNVELITPSSGVFCSLPDPSSMAAIEVEPGGELITNEVVIKGGYLTENFTEWESPCLLSLGVLRPHCEHTFEISIAGYPDAEFISDGRDIKVRSMKSPYQNHVQFKLTLTSLSRNELLRALIYLQIEPGLRQVLFLHGRSAKNSSEGEIAEDKLLFMPQTLLREKLIVDPMRSPTPSPAPIDLATAPTRPIVSRRSDRSPRASSPSSRSPHPHSTETLSSSKPSSSTPRVVPPPLPSNPIASGRSTSSPPLQLTPIPVAPPQTRNPRVKRRNSEVEVPQVIASEDAMTALNPAKPTRERAASSDKKIIGGFFGND